MTNLDATGKIQDLLIRKVKTQKEIIEELDLAKNTFYSRMRNHNWKKPELLMIERL